MINQETIFIISAILGIWTWVFKVFVIEALQKSIDELAATISGIVDKTHSLDTVIEKHGVMLNEINHRVEKLENEPHS